MEKPTLLTLSHAGRKFSATLDWDANIDDVLYAFYGLSIAAGYDPGSLLEEMREFSTKRLPDEED